MRAFIFDLNGTLVDTVYAHVLAWQQALEEAGIVIAGWRIHRRIGMSGGLFTRAVAREIGRPLWRKSRSGCSGGTASSSSSCFPSGDPCRARGTCFGGSTRAVCRSP